MEEIYSAMFDKIISGEYPAGTRLKQEEITEEFNISRTPVRIVLQQLEQDGLVEMAHNKGATVLPFTADEIEEIYEIRKSLELLCLEISAPVLSMHKLLELKRSLLENINNTNIESFAEIDSRIHSYIIDSSKKIRLINMLKQLYRLIDKFRSLGYQEDEIRLQATNEHIEIIDALCIRDMANAKALLKKHIENSKMLALGQLFRTKE
jgi:DNA-binding GntR family transcriptional regulator